jgi:hypothetical protein
MSIENAIRLFAGSFILVSLKLASTFNGASLYDGPTWLWLTAFVGLNLLQSAFTGWCLLETILRKFGMKYNHEIMAERKNNV